MLEPPPELSKTQSKNQQKKMIAKWRQEAATKNHQDRLGNSIGAEAPRAMNHQEVSISEAMKIQEVLDAMDVEWTKLEQRLMIVCLIGMSKDSIKKRSHRKRWTLWWRVRSGPGKASCPSDVPCERSRAWEGVLGLGGKSCVQRSVNAG